MACNLSDEAFFRFRREDEAHFFCYVGTAPLDELFDPGGEFLEQLLALVPPDLDLRERLETFLDQAIDGGPAARPVRPLERPGRPFRPDDLNPGHPKLATLDPADELTADRIADIAEALAGAATGHAGRPGGNRAAASGDPSHAGDLVPAREARARLIERLATMPRRQLGLAGWWLEEVRMRLHEARNPDWASALRWVEDMVAVVDRLLAQRIASPGELAMLAVTLLPSQVDLARQALGLSAPAVSRSGAARTAETAGTAETAETAADPVKELTDALETDLRRRWDWYVKNKGKKEHDAQDSDGNKTNLLPWAQIERNGRMALTLLHAVNGSFVPDLALLSQRVRIVDAFTRLDEELEQMKDDWPRRRDAAIALLRTYHQLTGRTESVMRARHGAPQYKTSDKPGELPEPANPAAELLDDAIKRLLSSPDGDGIDHDLMDDVLHVWRGWPASALSAEGIILIQAFKNPGGDQAVALQLQRQFLYFLHEGAHALAHSRYYAWAASLQQGSGAYAVAIEGSATGYTEAAASGLGDPRAAELRALVEGIYGADSVNRLADAALPRPDSIRYQVLAEYRRLRAAVGGSTFDNAYFLGLVEPLTKVIAAVALGSPKRPLGAEQLATTVAVLNQASAQERAALPVAAYVDSAVPDEVIDAALRQPGASHLHVYSGLITGSGG